MRLQDIMSTAVETVAPEASISEARSRMRTRRIRHLVVLDGREVVGVVSDRDLGGRLGPTGDRAVADLMERSVVTVTPETTVRQAANLLRGRNIGCLPIVDDGRVVGIVTVTDLLELIGRGVERPIARSKRWSLTRAQGRQRRTSGR